MPRKLFCEISPATYYLSTQKERLVRHAQDFWARTKFAHETDAPLPTLIYAHKSLIRRKLGNVDMQLQENKAHNLALAAPLVNGILIQPGETFSLWRLVGNTSAKRGYKEGLTIKQHAPSHDVGGGMCQLSNLIHWMVLHSPLDIIERHHHNDLDLFPDFGRQVPFGCGTSILYNYLDYRVQNNSEQTFQLLVSTNDTHLCGELRAQTVLDLSVHIVEEDAHFVCVDGQYYRRNRVVRRVNDKRTGNLLDAAIIDQANARVMYDPSFIAVSQVV